MGNGKNSIRKVPKKNSDRVWLLAGSFAGAFVLCLCWAGFTGHVWEDFWITFRSSKNLVLGHGLVFNPGDKLHTFTSPLGVLLPAAASALAGTDNDVAAVWVFRILSSAAFATAVTLLVAWGVEGGLGRLAIALMAGLVALDAKSIDFTTNGMETGFLLGFIAYTLWAMFVPKERRWVHLGVAWAGLMWSRPDSFLYVGLLGIAGLLFNDPARSGVTRGQWIKLCLQAGALCTVLYLPWFLWAWWYYGSPVPHTVVAKGALAETKTFLGAWRALLGFPQAAWEGRTSLEGTFLASYYQIGGWPAPLIWTTRVLAIGVALQWLLPWRSEVRVASFGFLGMHFYLSYYPFFAFPWYLPGTALLAAVVIGGVADQMGGWNRGWRQSGLRVGKIAAGSGRAVVVVLVAGQSWLTWEMMRQMKAEQEFSANAVRRKTGEWLREHAKAEDTVLMEPLGHIGYFSGLRTLDLPGLSSRESARAMKVISGLGLGWGHVADYLSPDWIVLRPTEMNNLKHGAWQLLGATYRQVAEFNTRPQVEELKLQGKGYLLHDAHWIIFKRAVPKRYRVNVTDSVIQSAYPLPIEAFDETALFKLHASGVMSVLVPDNASHFAIDYGLPAGTYTGGIVTDGVRFQIHFVNDSDEASTWLDATLNPVQRLEDRGVKRFRQALPPGKNREIILACLPGKSDEMDWSCWSRPVFE
jgi:hypothetical protein